MSALPADALDQLFVTARTQYDWQPEPLPEAQLRGLYDLVKLGPTSANCSPARFIFVTSEAERAKLSACASEGNRAKILAAPCTVIIGMDLEFHRHMRRLFPHTDASNWFTATPELTRETAFRNGTLQGGYLILAARALGLDAGPMSGFDKAAVDAAFWSGTRVETNFICSIGHGTGEKVFPRSPRFDFDEICRIV
ncbi:malonic semialdehyde reductase [Sandaracinobacteroides saxicola]|uniref:Putative NADH dehydrogenase/NAD(P)H nitroreductase H3309_08060 n=1 Tax=Sandaracinobacteroides saxicola TaxID=2759707 RepID=A0A7G5IM00_9SPHN|nr:malonic semialdehyde reductase [Sandaracinobacteroides saxicola]QMW24392.1 malonic semialdehyde reductase [Sandaracinobacteroides saxicola]